MPDVRRCVIYGCKSNSREHQNLKFFNFPARDNPLYEVWLEVCKESAGCIRAQRRPYICSKHFNSKEVGFRRLATGALPSLHLSAPPGFAEEEELRLAQLYAAQAEKQRISTLLSETVLEWVRRAHCYPDTAPTCMSRRQIRRVAKEARNLLGATLLINIDDYWLRRFRQAYLLTYQETNSCQAKSLKIAEIITELEPNAILLSDEEIAVLVEQEEKKLEESAMNRLSTGKYIRKKSKGTDEDSPKSKKPKIEPEKISSYEKEDSLSEGDVHNIDYEEDIDMSPASDVSLSSYQEALKHLKPLEDFALREENYRVLGLLSTLEIIFKSQHNA